MTESTSPDSDAKIEGREVQTANATIKKLLDPDQARALAIRGLPPEFKPYARGTASAKPPTTEVITEALAAKRLTLPQAAIARRQSLPGLTAQATAFYAALDGLEEKEQAIVRSHLTPVQRAAAQGQAVRGFDVAGTLAIALADAASVSTRNSQTKAAKVHTSPSTVVGDSALGITEKDRKAARAALGRPDDVSEVAAPLASPKAPAIAPTKTPSGNHRGG